MGKPKLFVAIRTGNEARILPDKLDEKFEIHYWPHSRNPTHEEMKANVNGVFGILCAFPGTFIDSDIVDTAGETLKVIVTASNGYTHLDVKAIKAKGIRIGYEGSQIESTVTVAEYAVGLLFATARHIADDHQALQKKTILWNRGLFNCNQHHTIWNSVVGVIGCGSIGTEVIKRLQAFSPEKILYSSRKPKSEVDAIGGEWRSVDDICTYSDFIIVTIQLNEETYHLVNRARLDLMKPNAILINIARGAIIDEKALVEVLRNKKIAGAGLDVFEEEPIQPDNPLLNMDNVVVTPHAAWCSFVAWRKKIDIITENILAAYENRKMPSEL